MTRQGAYPATLVAELETAVGTRHVLTDRDLVAPYEVDWTRRFRGQATAVVRPASAEETAAVLQGCSRHGVPVVPQGGNTGLVGGSVPRDGEVVVSLTRMRHAGEIDAGSLQVELEAGVTLAELQDLATRADLDAGVDLTARDSATVGGLVACDAGGLRAFRHGTVKARVAGLEAVLADGSITRRMSGLLKDNAGYDLPALLTGSEGTLALITRVRWRLVPSLRERALALIPIGSLTELPPLLATLRPRLPGLDACEFITDDGLELVVQHLALPSPIALRAPVYALLEVASRKDALDELAQALDDCGVDAVLADDAASRRRLWRVREAQTEAIAAAGIPCKLDVGVPLQRLAEFVDSARASVEALEPHARVIAFGHLADGNVHVNVLGAQSNHERVEDAVLRLAVDCGGTISAEHGVGMAKARWFPLARDPGELAAMRTIKDALDPAALLNPGVILAPASQLD